MVKTIGRKLLLVALFGTLSTAGSPGAIPANLAPRREAAALRPGLSKVQQTRERHRSMHRDAGTRGGPATHSPRSRVRVLQRELLGRVIEDIEYVANGPFANEIAMLCGRVVYGVPAKARSHGSVRRLFDLRQQILGAPRGIAYIASERLFAVVDSAQPTKLFLYDHRGNPHPSRTIQSSGDVPDFVEGLAYVPSTSSLFPDHLLRVTTKFISDYPFFAGRLQVIRRDGQMVAEIQVPDDVSFNFVLGVAFLAPDRILVSTADPNEIWTLDFEGKIVAGPVSTELLFAEGITQLADGRIATSEGAQLRFYDAALNRLPQDDRDASTRIGLVNPFSVAWNTDTHQHLVVAFTEESAGDLSSLQVAAVPLSLEASIPVVDLGVFPTSARALQGGATYMPDEHRIAVALRRRGSTPAEIALYSNDGTLVELIDASSIGGLGRPVGIAYIPPTREFVVLEQTQPRKVKVLARTGALAREIDLAPIGIGLHALTFFNPLHPSGGQFLLFGSAAGNVRRAIVTDFEWNPISEFDPLDELGLSFVKGVSALTVGPLTVAFAAVEDGSSPECVVFRLR